MAKIPTTRSDVVIIDENLFTNGTVTTFELIADIQYDEGQKFVGVAKRHPDDNHDIDVATMTARARAYESLSNSLMRRASGLVKHMDDTTADKAKKARSGKRQVDLKLQRIGSGASS